MAYVETDCTVEHEGRTFEAGGAVVTPDRILAYPGAGGVLRDWHGRQLGSWREVASWRMARWSPIGGWVMRQIEARVDGVTYTGRGFGVGCIYRGKRKAAQR